jgi:membrane protein YqaA with SNARE-associated domain
VGLFLSAFVSSTLFPGGSEVVLGLLAAGQQYDPWLLLAIASLGNTLSGLTSWLLGFLVARQRFSFTNRLQENQQRAISWLRKRGGPILLLPWLPVVGDPLCFAAGFVRMLMTLTYLSLSL